MIKIIDLLKENSMDIETLISPNEEFTLKITIDIEGDSVSFQSDADEDYFTMSINDFYNFIEQLKGVREVLETEIKL